MFFEYILSNLVNPKSYTYKNSSLFIEFKERKTSFFNTEKISLNIMLEFRNDNLNIEDILDFVIAKISEETYKSIKLNICWLLFLENTDKRYFFDINKKDH
jgi:hypothetical protein